VKLEDWHDFLVATGDAAATLAGIVLPMNLLPTDRLWRPRQEN
jgi:hypothetical protein